jgi:hypothetical protein
MNLGFKSSSMVRALYEYRNSTQGRRKRQTGILLIVLLCSKGVAL